uniref:Uncharacterized protein n=1 Tax=Lotus japonicus TaxID=34305 RepID=I3SGW4_LOTJA|nr:unknown [Lotus japonicus]
MASLNAKMALKPVCAIASMLLVLLLLACKLNLASASSGGVMGGNFFDSDSSSSSESSTINSEPLHRREEEAHSSPGDADGLGWGTHGGVLMFLIFIFGVFFVGFCKDTDANTITLCKLQVAMFGGSKGSSIQRDLTRIAKAADTSSREETIQALDRHPSYSIAGYSSVGQKQSMEDGKKCYDQLSNEERGKFDKETLVNLFNVEKRSQSINEFINEDTSLNVKESTTESQKFEEEELLNGLGDEYIVVTILVAAKGAHKLPNNGAEDLKKALQKLRSILLLPSKLLAGEVLWTPLKEGDTLSERKLLEDYPQLAECMKSFIVKKQE